MRTVKEILNTHAAFVLHYSEHNFEAIVSAMEDYALQKLEATVASYEIYRVNLVAMTLERDEAIERKSELEEWLQEYRDQLKKENAYHKNTGIINAINELLNES